MPEVAAFILPGKCYGESVAGKALTAFRERKINNFCHHSNPIKAIRFGDRD